MKMTSLRVHDFVYIFFVMFIGTSSAQAQTPFARMDRNSDNRLSVQEFRGKPSVFTRMDRNRDGYISLQEAKDTPLTGGTHHPSARGSSGMSKSTVEKESRGQATQLIYVDTHNHIVGRISGGSNRRLEYTAPVSFALESMDASAVKISLLMPMPQGDNQKNRLYLEDILPVVTEYPGRFAVLGGGGSLNVIIQEAVTLGHVSDAARKKFIDKAEELIRQGVVGFGEMTAEHFSMKTDHPYVSAAPDHPLFLQLADLAAKYDVPIDIHMEAIPIKMELPSRLKSPPNPAMLKPNLTGFEKLLSHNRNARIVWVHLGWDNTGKRTVALTRELLSKHPNLYMSIRVAGGMQARNVVSATFPLDSDADLKQDWLAMFQEFPDRFVIGSDEIVLQNNQHPSAGSIKATVGLLNQLPEQLRRKIGYENAYRLYRLKQ